MCNVRSCEHFTQFKFGTSRVQKNEATLDSIKRGNTIDMFISFAGNRMLIKKILIAFQCPWGSFAHLFFELVSRVAKTDQGGPR